MKKLYSFATVMLLSILSYAQNGMVTVKDLSTLAPIADASVYVYTNPNDAGTLLGKTNAEGQYTVTPKNSKVTDVFYIQAEGYLSKSFLFNETVTGFELLLSNAAVEYNTLVISAKRYQEELQNSPVQATVLSRNNIQFLNPANSADLLANSGAALVQKSQLGGGSPILRGFEANKVLYVVDGVRMSNAIYRGGHLQDIITLDPMAMDRVEVVYGPGASTYGSDALGGVMHFYTRSPQFSTSGTKVRTGAMLRYSTANQSAVHANFEISGNKWASFTALTYNNYGDLRQGNVRNPAYPTFGQRPWYVERADNRDTVITNTNPNVQVGSAYQQYDLLQKISFKQSDKVTHTLNLQYSNTNDVPRYDRLVQTSGSNPKYAEWYYGPQKRAMVAYHLNLSSSKYYDNARITAAYQDIDQSRHDRKFNNNNRNNREENVKVYSLNADFNKALATHGQTLGYGLEAYYNDVTSTAYTQNILTGEKGTLDTRYPDGGSTMSSLAAYLTHSIDLGKKVKLSEGIRFSQVGLTSNFTSREFFDFPFSSVNQNNKQVTGSIGLVYNPNQNWKAKLMLASGFRAPNVDDVTKVFESTSGNLIVPNDKLKPETVRSIEGTLERRFNGKTQLALNGYYSQYLNAITTGATTYNGADSVMYDGSMSAVYTSINATEAYIYGGSLALNSQVNDHFGIQSSVVYTYGRIKTDNGDTPLDHIPPVYGRTSFSYQQKKFRGEFSVLYNGWKRLQDYRMNAEDNEAYATSNGMPAWYTLNVRASYQLQDNIQLMVGIENLLDANYRVFASNISGAGRNLTVTLRGNF